MRIIISAFLWILILGLDSVFLTQYLPMVELTWVPPFEGIVIANLLILTGKTEW